MRLSGGWKGSRTQDVPECAEEVKAAARAMRLSDVITKAEWCLLADQPSRITHTGKRNLALLHVMYFGGLGFSEVCDLSPWNLNGRAQGIYRPTEFRRAARLVFLPDRAWAVLEEWAELRPRSNYFFSTLRGNRLREDYVKAVVRRYGDRAGITKPHEVPASRAPRPKGEFYASRLLGRGLPEYQLARRLTTARLP
jgi:site-specific recombinase XerD